MEIWSDERVELLKKLWADGLSASQIAAQLGGVTRNAVIGKVHRLGLSGRTKTQSAPARSNRPKTRPTSTPRPAIQPLVFGNTALKQEARPEPAPVVVPVAAPIPFPAPSPEQRVTILQLTEKTCRWPEGDPASAEFRFCGSLSTTGLPYCAYHCAVAYQPSQERKREQRRALAAGR